MNFIYLLLVCLFFVGCESKKSSPLAINNPSSLRASGTSKSLDIVLKAAVEDGASIVIPAQKCPEEVSELIGDSPECGAVRVPEDHRNNNNNNSLAIGYMKIPKVFDSSKPLLVLEQGGPGGSSILLAAMYVMVNEDLTDKFNILAVEQRGTPWTYPLAICEDVIDIEVHLLEKTISAVDARFAIRAANKRCLDRVSKAMDISKISTYQIAKDIVYAAQKMGFDEFNYYGVSYGTVVGQYLLKYSDKHLKNIVLDSPVVVGKFWMNDAMENMDTLAQFKFESYIKNNLPHLTIDEGVNFFKTVTNSLNHKPLKIHINSENRNLNLVVDGDFYFDLIFKLLVVYSQDQIVNVLLEATKDYSNNTAKLKNVLEMLLPQVQILEPNLTSIMYQSIICREFSFADFDSAKASKNWTFLPKVFSEESLEASISELDLCNLNIPQSDEDVILKDPVVSDKTILVVGGALDYVTHPKYVNELVVNIPNAYTSVFKEASHGVYLSKECITDSITNYLLSPVGAYTNLCELN